MELINGTVENLILGCDDQFKLKLLVRKVGHVFGMWAPAAGNRM